MVDCVVEELHHIQRDLICTCVGLIIQLWHISLFGSDTRVARSPSAVMPQMELNVEEQLVVVFCQVCLLCVAKDPPTWFTGSTVSPKSGHCHKLAQRLFELLCHVCSGV